ncbi:MAG: acylphosphatase [Rhodospirillaceae bacterium]|nr:MAG: acylphosphatase [Rhodospirillaceae bacterium]
MTKSVHAIFQGRVQGVWFRAWTAEKATALGLNGWVRNRTDGTVEAVFSGPEDKVDAMLKKAKKGPLLARVDRVDVQPTEAPTELGFVKRSSV